MVLNRVAHIAPWHQVSPRCRSGVPVDVFHEILGVPRPGSPAEESLNGEQQRLDGLTQDGWHVTYGAYVDAHGQTLPARLTLEREAVRVRLVVDDWQL